MPDHVQTDPAQSLIEGESRWISFYTLDDTEDARNAPLAYRGDEHCPRPDDRRSGQLDLARLHGGLPRASDFVRLGLSTSPGALGSATAVLDVRQVREVVEQLSAWLQVSGWPAPPCGACTSGGSDLWTTLLLPTVPTPVPAG